MRQDDARSARGNTLEDATMKYQVSNVGEPVTAPLVSDTFLLINLHANVLFDSGANYSCISHKFG